MEVLVVDDSMAERGRKAFDKLTYLYRCARPCDPFSPSISAFASTAKADTHVTQSSCALRRVAAPRLAPGLSLTSHALSCSSLFGIPSTLLRRASDISHALSTFSLDALDDDDGGMGDAERSELREAEKVGRRFVAWEVPPPESEALEADEVRALVASLLDAEERKGSA